MPDDQTPTTDPQAQSDAQVTQPSALPEDNGTPAQPATDDGVMLGDAHQLTDNQSDIDSHEAYDAGVATAAGAADVQPEPPTPPAEPTTPPTPEENQSTDDAL